MDGNIYHSITITIISACLRHASLDVTIYSSTPVHTFVAVTLAKVYI